MSMSHPPSRSQNQAVAVQARRILDERNARKRAEYDSQLLANRIQHLKDEMERAKKRTVEAMKRQKEIHEMKVSSQKRKELAAIPKPNRKKREEEEQLNGPWIHSGGNFKVSKPEGMKKEVILKLKAEREAKEKAARALKIETIKKKRLEMMAVKKKREEERLKALKEQYRKKMEGEARKREEAEKKLTVLEDTEAELIEELRKQQEEQKIAYQKLQDTIVKKEE
ncbi:hypothetical protein TrRE_jg13143 [Triparma retinervis]|uniref:Uncharacterized protein n=1 Tax=Triparma retinervis TaxID=2557542 RepID=A0A9W7F824_9STRA|nr:hypothetical protein TrRE_jg13143 [Triparma retinervis]